MDARDHRVPREIPTYTEAIMDLSEEEWAGFGLAYAYGQTVPEGEFEDLFKFRKFYRAQLAEEDQAKKA